MFLIYLLTSLVVMAIVEYLFHRWPMHQKLRFGKNLYFAHTTLHHSKYFRLFDSEHDPAGKLVSIRMSAFEHFGAAFPFLVLLWLFVEPLSAIVFASVVIAHAITWSAFHVEMHDPRGRWYSRNWFYRYIRANHKAHHVNTKTNFAAVFPPFMDKVFGTYSEPIYI